MWCAAHGLTNVTNLDPLGVEGEGCERERGREREGLGEGERECVCVCVFVLVCARMWCAAHLECGALHVGSS